VKVKAELNATISLGVEYVESASRSLIFALPTVKLMVTDEGTRSSGLQRVSFDWTAYGDAAFTATLKNAVAAY
jgi:hypothetical protein